MAQSVTADVRRINRHWQVLCDRIGPRVAGSDGEQQAADYIADQMNRLGLAHVHWHRFEFPNDRCTKCQLKLGRPGRLRRVDYARPMSYTVSTPPRGAGGPVAYLQSGLPHDFRQPLKGRVGLLIGSLALANDDLKRRIVRSGMAGLLVVDSRVPFDWPISIGTAPQWVNGYTVPTAGIPYLEAVELVEQLPRTAHLIIRNRCFADTSQNVIGEVVGTERPDQVIVVSGHHDAVPGCVGANDNASGVIFTLELARRFARRPPKRTIRFISYGVEERLSVGAYLYARSLRPVERRRIVLAVNADGVAATVGTDVARITGTPRLERLVRNTWEQRRHPVTVESDVNPYSDQFPMNIIGVPSVWLSRTSMMTDGYWNLHSVHDNLDHVSARVLARTIDSAALLLHRVANAPRLPFVRRLAPDVAKRVRRTARTQYRHPWSAATFDYDI